MPKEKKIVQYHLKRSRPLTCDTKMFISCVCNQNILQTVCLIIQTSCEHAEILKNKPQETLSLNKKEAPALFQILLQEAASWYHIEAASPENRYQY